MSESRTVVIKRKKSDRLLPGTADTQDPTDEVFLPIYLRGP
jgi:hypothetical protein